MANNFEIGDLLGEGSYHHTFLVVLPADPKELIDKYQLDEAVEDWTGWWFCIDDCNALVTRHYDYLISLKILAHSDESCSQ